MSSKNIDTLFQLIKTLTKAEKRNFKLYIKRNSANDDLKIIRIFDAIDKQEEYNEQQIFKKIPGTEKRQLYNLKSHLYKEILASLRLLKSSDSIDLQLTEHFDYAHLLYKKGLFYQSLRWLDKAKEFAKTNHKYYFLTKIVSLEKRIESLHITQGVTERLQKLMEESEDVSRHISDVTRLSNLSMQLFGWFIQNGHARNLDDDARIKNFMQQNMPAADIELHGFYEKLFYYQSFCWFAYIRQDFLQYYRYSKKWVEMFDSDPLMIRVETSHYIKGLHYLLNAHFNLRNFEQFDKTLVQFEAFAKTERVVNHDNFLVQAFIYISQGKLNQHYMKGTFKEGLALVPFLQEKLKEYAVFLDEHRILVLRYKIASLYFGSNDFSTSIDFLNRIINNSGNIRTDLQCYSRLLHLMAHFELGNDEILESLSKSVYRFMARMKNIAGVEEAIFKFLRSTKFVNSKQIIPELNTFLSRIKHFENDRFQNRAFAYLDVISWVESKVYNKTMSEIIQDKFLQSRRSGIKPID